MNLVTDLSAGEYFTDGTTATFYLKKSYTGQSCTSDNAPSPDNPSPTNKTNPPCLPGHGVMTSSTGKISCVPPGTPGSNEPIIKKEEVITTGPNGETIRKDKTTIRDPKTGVETTTETIETCNAYSDENRHQFQSNVGHYFQRKPCHLFRLNHSQSFHSKVGH